MSAMHTSKTAGAQPRSSRCQTRSIGIIDLFECLVADAGGCPHRLSFGASFFCRHPLRAQFSSRKKAVVF